MTDSNSVLTELRSECPALDWQFIAGKIRFWDQEKWFWISNPYKDGVEAVDPLVRYPQLTEKGVSKMIAASAL